MWKGYFTNRSRNWLHWHIAFHPLSYIRFVTLPTQMTEPLPERNDSLAELLPTRQRSVLVETKLKTQLIWNLYGKAHTEISTSRKASVRDLQSSARTSHILLTGLEAWSIINSPNRGVLRIALRNGAQLLSKCQMALINQQLLRAEKTKWQPAINRSNAQDCAFYVNFSAADQVHQFALKSVSFARHIMDVLGVAPNQANELILNFEARHTVFIRVGRKWQKLPDYLRNTYGRA